uniref:Uncharacterized protein n=1 Tax=Lotharella globosa TaxID=91324 RepID=A0A7S3ZCV1_9EUKA
MVALVLERIDEKTMARHCARVLRFAMNSTLCRPRCTRYHILRVLFSNPRFVAGMEGKVSINDLRDRKGWTVVFGAMYHTPPRLPTRPTKNVQLLIDAKASVNQFNDDGRFNPLLYYATRVTQNPDHYYSNALFFLLVNKADVLVRDEKGRTPLQILLEVEYETLSTRLLKRKTDAALFQVRIRYPIN